MSYVLPTTRVSAAYARIQQHIQEVCGVGAIQSQSLNINRSQLRLVVPITAGVGVSTEFDLRTINNNSVNGPYECRLNSGDVFFATDIAIKLVTIGEGDFFAAPGPLTYPDATEGYDFGYMGLWEGATLEIKAGSTTVAKKLELQHSMVIPDRISSAAGELLPHGCSDHCDGFMELEPFIPFCGTESNSFKHTWGPYDKSKLGENTYAILMVDGFIWCDADANYCSKNKANFCPVG